MARRFILITSLVLILISVALMPGFSGSKYIQITGANVNIRFKNATSSALVAKAKKGNIFELVSEKGNWFEIKMFAGEYRYIHRSLGKIVSYVPTLPKSEATRKAIFNELVEAEDKSILEADRKYPPSIDIYKNIDYYRILDDRYKLEIFNRYNVEPPIYTKLIVEGITKGWK